VHDPDNSADVKNLVDRLSPDLMAKIVTEITKRLKDVKPKKSESETEFFDCVAKRNPKVHEGKEDPTILEEWIRQTEKIFDVVETLDNKRINIGTFICGGELLRLPFRAQKLCGQTLLKLYEPSSTLCICKNKNKGSS